MAWPPTERDILEIARDSHLTTGVTSPAMPWADDPTPRKPHGDRVVLANDSMTEAIVTIGDPDPFILIADKPLSCFDPAFMDPLVDKGLLHREVGKFATLYTLTAAGEQALN